MIAWLISQAWPYLLGLVALLGVYWRGRYNGKADAHRKTLESYPTQRKVIDNADLGTGASDGERIKRLSEFSRKP